MGNDRIITLLFLGNGVLNEEKRRISLGLKQAQENPWAAFAERHPVGSVVELDSLPLKYNGIYTIMDTGPSVQDRVIRVTPSSPTTGSTQVMQTPIPQAIDSSTSACTGMS